MKMQQVKGTNLELLAAVYGVERMHARVWWTLWLWNRPESDASLRNRCTLAIWRVYEQV